MAKGPNSPVFKPKKLRRVDLERPIQANQRMLPQDILDEAHQRKMDAHDRHRVWNDRQKTRTKYYIVGAIIGMWLFNFLFTWAGSTALYIQVPVYAAYGAYLAFFRPGCTHAVLATNLCGFTVVLLDGIRLGFLGVVFSVLIWTSLGNAVGATELLKER